MPFRRALKHELWRKPYQAISANSKTEHCNGKHGNMREAWKISRRHALKGLHLLSSICIIYSNPSQARISEWGCSCRCSQSPAPTLRSAIGAQTLPGVVERKSLQSCPNFEHDVGTKAPWSWEHVSPLPNCALGLELNCII